MRTLTPCKNLAKIRNILLDGLTNLPMSTFYNTLSQLDHVSSIAVMMDVSVGYCSYIDQRHTTFAAHTTHAKHVIHDSSLDFDPKPTNESGM